jgi:DNA uptake protein and related DNA-binding proteins
MTAQGEDGSDALVVVGRKPSEHTAQAEEIRRNYTPRRCESFPFDPNTVSVDDLMRLGFSFKQASSIDNYRQKGGRFRRKADFAKSYVVEDSVYQRLEQFIEIPKIDLNAADSTQFQSLPGIGRFFAAKMAEYREELGGYSFPEQLMDIWHFDREKYEGLKDLITIGHGYPPYPLWTLPEEKLSMHPYIGKQAAHGIVLFRENSPRSEWTVENLVKAGVLGNEAGSRLVRCRLEVLESQ